jgi:GntR family transcriptional regulator, galactonate operon transcriptional repressor
VPLSKVPKRGPTSHPFGSDRSTSDRPARHGADSAPLERSLHSQLAGRLGREIVGGLYPSGSLLPNAVEMCARYSVSRTALREAYSVMAAKALIVARPKVGTRVRPKSDWNMLDPEMLSWHLQSVPTEDIVADLFVLRQMVEPAAAALAAAERSSGTLERITEAYGRMERFKNGSGDLVKADLDFHLAILEATGNHFLTALGGLIQASLECTFKLSWEGAGRIQDDRLDQHQDILRAICDGSAELARERMAGLLRASINDVLEFLRQRDVAREAIAHVRP